MRIDVYHHFPAPPADTRMDDVLTLLHSLIDEVKTMSGTLQTEIDQLKADVTAENTVIDSATAMISGFAKQLADAIAAATAAGATPDQIAALDALHSSVTAETASLAAAVSANTQTSPDAPPAVTPTP